RGEAAEEGFARVCGIRTTGSIPPHTFPLVKLQIRGMGAQPWLAVDTLRCARVRLKPIVRHSAGPHPTTKGQTLTGTGLAGVTFEVQPLVSPDRRYLRLQTSQQVSQLAGIDKVKTLDVSSGKEVEVETPTLNPPVKT